MCSLATCTPAGNVLFGDGQGTSGGKYTPWAVVHAGRVHSYAFERMLTREEIIFHSCLPGEAEARRVMNSLHCRG